MIKGFVVLAVGLSFGSQSYANAKAPAPVKAALVSATAFAADSTEPIIGFSGRLVRTGVAAATVFSQMGSKLAVIPYDCPLKINGPECKASPSQLKDYTFTQNSFSLGELKTAANEVVELFAKRLSPSAIEVFKLWQVGGDIYATTAHSDGSKEVAVITHYYCHYHGAHIDCHVESRPGPSEPTE